MDADRRDDREERRLERNLLGWVGAAILSAIYLLFEMGSMLSYVERYPDSDSITAVITAGLDFCVHFIMLVSVYTVLGSERAAFGVLCLMLISSVERLSSASTQHRGRG